LFLSFCLLFHLNAKIFPPQLSFSLFVILIYIKTNLLSHDTAQFRTGVDTVRLAASPGDSSAGSSLSLTSQDEQFYNVASAVLSQQGMGADGDGDRGSDDDKEKKDEEEEEEEEEEDDDEKASIDSLQDPDVEEEEEEQESSEKEQEDSFLYSTVESFQDLGARLNEGSLTIRAVRGQYEGEVFIVRSVQVSRRTTGRNSVTCIAQDGGTRTTSFYDVNDFEVAN